MPIPEKCNGSRWLFYVNLSEISKLAKGCRWISKVKAVGRFGKQQEWCRRMSQVTVAEFDTYSREIPNAKCVQIYTYVHKKICGTKIIK